MMKKILFLITLLLGSIAMSAQPRSEEQAKRNNLLTEFRNAFKSDNPQNALSVLDEVEKYGYFPDSIKLFRQQLNYYTAIDSLVFQMSTGEIKKAEQNYAKLTEYPQELLNVDYYPVGKKYYRFIPYIMEHHLYVSPELTEYINKILQAENVSRINISGANAQINGKSINLSKELVPDLIVDYFMPIKNGIGGIHGKYKIDNIQNLTPVETINTVLGIVVNSCSFEIFFDVKGKSIEKEKAEQMREVRTDDIIKEIDSILTPMRDVEGKWGYVNSNGDNVITCEYDNVLPFSFGFGIVYLESKVGYIDIFGNCTWE